MSLFYKTNSLILIKHQPFICILLSTHLDDDMSICLEAYVLMQLDAHVINAWMLVQLHASMLVPKCLCA